MNALSPILQVTASDNVDLQEARRTQAFEALEEMFISLLLKEMRKSIPDSGLTEKSEASKRYEEMMDETLATQMAKSSQMGIAKGLSEQWRAQHLRESMQSDEVINTQQAIGSLKK